MKRELRQYQITALDDLRTSIGQGVKRIVLQSPTGSGKTMVAAAIAEGALAKGKRMAFVVPALSLIEQTIDAFYKEEIYDIGVIQRQHSMTDWSKPIQICSVQTLARRCMPEADVVVFDEVHQLHKTHIRWLADDKCKQTTFIGLSATPWTRGLGKYFDSLQVVSTTADMIEKGYLSPFRVFAVAAPDLEGVRVVAGDYHEGDLSERMRGDNGKLTADIVSTWQERWGQDRTFCFAVNLAHARQLQERFTEAGIACGYQDGETTIEDRLSIRKKFRTGQIQVLVSVGTLTTGTDEDVRCISYCRPTRSEMLFVQCIGRGLRPADGKESLLLLDHSSTTQRLGFVTDIDARHNCLDDGIKKHADAKKHEVPLPKACGACGYLAPKREKTCSNCGHEFPKPKSNIIERYGRLVELSAAGKYMNGHGQKTASGASWEERASFLAQLKCISQEKQRKPYWAFYSYRDRFGEMPPSNIRDVAPQPAGIKVRQWVKSRIIAWAKAKDHTANVGGAT